MEFVFLCFDEQLVLQKKLEDLSDMSDMFLSEDVIEVDEHEPVQHVTENVFNQGLEHTRIFSLHGISKYS